MSGISIPELNPQIRSLCGHDLLESREVRRLRELERLCTTAYSTPMPKFLRFIADRLVNVYGESPNVDFVLSLRERADAIEKAITGQ